MFNPTIIFYNFRKTLKEARRQLNNFCDFWSEIQSNLENFDDIDVIKVVTFILFFKLRSCLRLCYNYCSRVMVLLVLKKGLLFN